MPMCYFNIDHDIVNIRRAADVASLLVMPRLCDSGEDDDHHNSILGVLDDDIFNWQ